MNLSAGKKVEQFLISLNKRLRRTADMGSFLLKLFLIETREEFPLCKQPWPDLCLSYCPGCEWKFCVCSSLKMGFLCLWFFPILPLVHISLFFWHSDIVSPQPTVKLYSCPNMLLFDQESLEPHHSKTFTMTA